MTKNISFFIFFFISRISFAQNKFVAEKAYFLDTAKAKITYVGKQWKPHYGLDEVWRIADSARSDIWPDKDILIDTITSAAYAKYVTAYKSKIVKDTSFITKTDSSFTIHKENFTKTFPAFRICECSDAKYLGVLQPLNLIIIYEVDYHNEISYSFMIDTKTGMVFDLPGDGDDSALGYYLSPKNNKFITFAYDVYSTESVINIYDVVKENNLFYLKESDALTFSNAEIENVTWINEKSLAAEITLVKPHVEGEDYSQEKKRKQYIKISMK